MIFQLSETVRLKGEERQWTLERYRKRKRKGAVVGEWAGFKYYANAAQAFRACSEYDARIAADWDAFERRIQRLEAAISQTLEPMLMRPEEALKERLLPANDEFWKQSKNQ